MSATPRKVIQLTPYYPPHLGGVERVAQALARGLSAGHDVEVWTTDLGTQKGKTESTEAFPVHRLPAFEIAHTPVAPGLARRLLALPAGAVVHVHVAQALWPEMVALAAARRGFSVVAHFHLDVDATGRAGVLLPAYKRHCLMRTLRRAQAVVALTARQAEFLVEEYALAPGRLLVVPNGVDQAFLELGPARGPGHPLHVLFVGRLDAQKNIPRLVRAVARVTEPVEVVIVGDGEERERCQSLRDRLGLEHVRFVGPQFGPELVQWYEWADLFVLPSDREGMPLALLEAMAAGLAVVTTDVSELVEQVGDAGLVVAAGEQPLARAIGLLAGDRKLLAVLQHRSRARGRSFGWDTAVAQLTGLYESLPGVIGTAAVRVAVDSDRSAWHRAEVLVAGVVVLAGFVALAPYVPWLTPVAGLVLTVVLPATLLGTKLRFPGSPTAHRVVLAVALAVFGLVLVGLAINTVLPWVGDGRPLARTPVALAVLAENVVLILWRASMTPRWPAWPSPLPLTSRWVWGLLGLSLFSCVVGTNRLNNGASSSVTLAAFVILLVALALSWYWRTGFSDGEMAAVFYHAALILLLATSLRGWYITGHDIQREYHVFQVTNAADRWNISNFHDPYNACMSLTILPTMWTRMLRIDDPYVFKIFFQAFFALSAASLYLVCRRHFSRTSAFLAAIFYISFPTFLTDMPFITRQETGFTFLSVAALVLMSDSWAPATRRFWFVIFGIAIVLSHYSTTYLLLIALVFAQFLWRGWQVGAYLRTRRRPRLSATPAWGRPVAGLSTLVLIATAAFLWTVPATHTSSQLRLTVTDTVETLLGRQQGATSTDISYSLFHSAVLSPGQELAQYRAETLKVTAGDASNYLSRATVDSYPLPVANQRNLPVTSTGRVLARLGMSPTALNGLMRSLLAKYYQVAAVTGLLLLVWGSRRRRGIPASQREYLCLAAASFVGLVAVVVLPDLSVEYGLLRAFQQALIFLSPLVAETTLALVWLVAGRRAGVAAVAVGLIALASLSGAIPQATGGYPPQLNLNNAGTYYNDYYLHPQELDAISWLDGAVRSRATVQAEIETDRYTSYLVGDAKARTTADVFPTLIEKHAFVFLGYATVTLDKASVSIDGNTVTYLYPMGLLNSTKDLVFSSNGARIYR